MSASEMKIDPVRAAALVSQIRSVQSAVSAVANGRPVRLVAVSKLKPANDILALHQEPVCQEHFGENYAQELSQKAEMLPASIKWHFIGGLQSGHCKSLAKIPNLWAVSSVDSLKKAQLLSKHRADLLAANPAAAAPLNIHIQVNTSGEDNKSGCPPGPETLALCRAVTELPALNLLGLMTIGAIARSQATTAETENEDFRVLVEQADMVKKELGLDQLELSMGMSEDFEGAINMGSGEVRVGSTIFGSRPPKAEAQLLV
ncbi:hypothetical protein TD95_002648 [Thielaviopsis punctulata]|uniref:Pyridoxal phosphate homeostasis protein n=1 Tax=Thielaviopsis punctulata TaxID=72032 RepID=A0A0F4Z8G8_9PEZI|nr:hypothetical protein TD95_002648 [Thielaviopsis punctulata]